MNYNNFLNGVINGGIEGAKRSYSNPNNPNHPMMLQGSIAGFEACRSQTPEELAVILENSGRTMTERHRNQDENYWWFNCFYGEVNWVCNCVSAMLMNEGLPTIIVPTYRGVMRANEVMRGVS